MATTSIPSTPPLSRRPFGRREILLLGGLLLGFAVAVALIASIQELFLPLLLSIFFYYLLSQMVNGLERRGVSRGAGARDSLPRFSLPFRPFIFTMRRSCAFTRR